MRSETDYFQQVGLELSQRYKRSEPAEDFPNVAADVLTDMPAPAEIDFLACSDWALSQTPLPSQVNFSSSFGEPPLVVYDEPRFFVELLVWFPSRTGTHGHGFCGAFVVISGYSLEADYDFHELEEPCQGVKFGSLEPRSIAVNQSGTVRRIHPGHRFIHAVAHMGNPSMTLVIRTKESRAPRQYSYHENGVAIASYLNKQTQQRQAEMLQALARVSPKLFEDRLVSYLLNGDLHRLYASMNHFDFLLEKLECSNRVWASVIQKFGNSAARIQESLACLRRSNRIWGGIGNLREPEQRLKAALRDFFPSRSNLDATLRRSFPGANPGDLLNQWADTAKAEEAGKPVTDTTG